MAHHRYPYLDTPLPIAFAHRGGAAVGDENTLAAFDRAVSAGYTYLETDVHATRDGVPVVFHDETLDRVFGRPGRVAELSWRDLATERADGEVAVPRLAELLESYPRTRLNVDLKSDAVLEPTLEVVNRTGTRDRVLLASFDDRRLRRVRRLAGPRQATSMGEREVAAVWLGSRHGRALAGFRPGVAAVQVPVWFRRIRLVDDRFVRHAHRLGLQVHVWTVDDPGQMQELLDLGVDGIMTDRIEVLRDVLMARGRWPQPAA